MKGRVMKSPERRWGIVVGVDEYAHANEFLHNLQGCVVDARKMYDTMMNRECCGFLEDHVKLLENPTFGDLEEAFVEVGAEMAPGDELWFYFAGHGYSDKTRRRDNGYLLLSGAKYDRRGALRSEGSMSSRQLGDLVADHVKPGATVVLFLDCCCAASVGLNTGDRAVCETDGLTSFRDISFAERGADSPNCDEPIRQMSFMATGEFGRAQEDQNGGAFTKQLIEGLFGGTNAHPTVFEGFYVTAGELGAYLGARMQGQDPTQKVVDPAYPLSIAPKQKKKLDQIKVLDSNVGKWLADLKGCVYDKQFAERVLVREESFAYDGVMRNVLRLVSDPGCPMPVKGDAAAELLKAFHELKRLLEGAGETAAPRPAPAPDAKPAEPHGGRRRPSPEKTDGDDSLTQHDKELLDDVEERLREIDGMDVDFSDIRRMSQSEAAAALDAVALRRIRALRGKAYCDALYTSNERDHWSNLARKGFTSKLESAVRQLVLDDQMLSQRRK